MISLQNLKGIAFDFDGTIAHLTIDFSEMRRIVLSHLHRFGIPPDGLHNLYVLEMIAAGKRQLARQFPGQETLYEQQALALIRDVEVAAAQRGCLFSGMREMLVRLRARGIKTGVVTRNCREAVEQVFPDIGAFIEVVLTRDDTPRVKPDPDHLKHALHAFALPAAVTAMVGDHKMDMILAKDVGAVAIGVLTGHDSAAELKNAGADLILPEASALADIFTCRDI